MAITSTRHMRFTLAAVIVILAACSGGGGGSGDAPAVAFGVPSGIDRFLLFPNPIVQGGGFVTDTSAYAAAYYAAVDPYAQRTTLNQFEAANGFGSAAGGAQERVAVYRNVRDLGYGRRITGRYVPGANGIPERVVFLAENYAIDLAAGGSARGNVEAAVARDRKWHLGTSAIEWSCHPADAALPDCRRYAKYYSFAPDGQRQLEVDLDGRGAKAMPGPCITCHGGRADPLEADGSFPKVPNTLLDRPADVQGQLHMLPVDTFEWSTTQGYTRPDQEAKLKDMNIWVLCTYPVRIGAANATGPNGCVRRAAGANEWEGEAAALIENAYGGAGLPYPSFDDSVVPADWTSQSALYEQVVRPYCRTCHSVRGTHSQSDIDFATAARFTEYAQRIKTHVFDRGNMPLALRVYDGFWMSDAPTQLARYLDAVLGRGAATEPSGAPLRPGRPIADAGPALRMAKAGSDAPLSGADSLFATSYMWEVTAAPSNGDATIWNANSSVAGFRATVPGDYDVQLTVGNGRMSSSAATTIRVSAQFPDPSSIRLAHVLDVLRNNPQGGSASCDASGCHATTAPRGTTTAAPIVFAAVDRNGSGGGEDAADMAWLLEQLRGRVNLTEVAASTLLRKPTGYAHHGGKAIDLSTGPDSGAALASFSKLYYWILNGMPGGGAAANAGPDSTLTLRFTGAPPAASIALDGSRSIGARSYLWSIVVQPDAAGNPASISDARNAAPTLSVRVAGTYVVQLQIADGGSYTDSARRTIVVSEAAFSDSFRVTPGTVDTSTSVNQAYYAPGTAWVPDRPLSASLLDEPFDSLDVWASNSSGTGSSAIVADPDPDANIGRVLRLETGPAAGSVAGRQKVLSAVPSTFGVMVILELNAVGANPDDALVIQLQTSEPHAAKVQMRFGDGRMELFYDGAWHTIMAHGGAYYTEWWVQCNYRGSGTLYDLEVFAGTEFVGKAAGVNLPAGPADNAGLMVMQQFSGANANRESRIAVAQVGADVRPSNLTLLSRAYPVLTSPARGRLVILDEDISNALVPNTDLVASISRDNGDTWTPLTLTNSGVYGPGEIDPTKPINILSGEAAFGGPPGTALKYKVQSSGGRYHALQGIRMEWE
jgi:hypothetical protein